jgi:4-carboxymuconolactone decarboxylase
MTRLPAGTLPCVLAATYLLRPLDASQPATAPMAPAAIVTSVAATTDQTATAHSTRLTKPRILPRPESAWSDADRALIAAYSREESPGNDIRTLLNDPELLRGVMPFVNYVSGESTLAPRHREILILRTAWLCRNEYVWAHHAAAAKRTGLGADVIRRVAEGPEARGWDAFEAALVRLADQLHHNASISDATWHTVAARADTRQQIDAVFAVTEFTMLAGLFNSIGVQIEAGFDARFPAGIPYRVVVPAPEPPLKAARIAPLEESEWTPETRAMLASVNTSGHVIAIYRTFAQNPKLYPPRQLLSEHIRLHSTLSAHARELLILRTGWLARSEYEWAQHLRSGRQAGLDSNRIAAGADAPGWDPFDVALVRAADELYRDDYISDATWNALAARFNASELMDVLITAGGYRMVSMALNALGVQLEPGAERFPVVPVR